MLCCIIFLKECLGVTNNFFTRGVQMSKEIEVRATDKDLRISALDFFKPGADPDEWIEQLAGPYRERPWAVIRELFQNASDTLQGMQRDKACFIEFALLNTEVKLEQDRYHFVIRDSGEGMDDETFCKRVGILGLSSKKGDKETIGQFGVGFYSTHAICLEATVISKTSEQEKFTAWKYIPTLKKFSRLKENELNELIKTDFDQHPMESRRRHCGTSVYINVNFQRLPQCEDWLIVENLVRDVQRDFFILSVPIYVADYTSGISAEPVLNMHGTDLSSVPLNICPAPWDIAEDQNKSAVLDVLQAQLPYTKPEHLPKEWFVFHKKLGKGSVSGVFYLVDGGSDGYVSLCMKRMWVETANDLHPLALTPVFALVNFEPDDENFDVRVTAYRDHIVRDCEFVKGREIVEDAGLDFFEHCGNKLIETIAQNTHDLLDQEEKVECCRSILGKSHFFAALNSGNIPFNAILTDVPKWLRNVLKREDCVATLRERLKQFVERKMHSSVDVDNLPHAFEALEKAAQKSAQRQQVSTDRAQIVWNPRVSEAFLDKVGKFIPVTIAMRRRKRDGTFDIISIAIPLSAIPILDPSSVKGIDVLMKGNVEEYLAKNQDRSSVIIPSAHGVSVAHDESRILFLAAFATTCEQFKPKLRFVEFRRDLFQDISTKDVWEPLIACFDSIVNGGIHGHQKDGVSKLNVCVKGYQGDRDNLIPLLSSHDDKQALLVLNAYNPLMKELLPAYTNAASRNDPVSTALVSKICHELYHHTLPAEASSRDVDRHALETRMSVFTQVLNILQQYLDMKE